MKTDFCIVLFKNDFRICDNEAIIQALAFSKSHNIPLLGLYIHDQSFEPRPLGAASLWWLKRSLVSLDKSFSKHNSRLLTLPSFEGKQLKLFLNNINPIAIFCGHQTKNLSLKFINKISKLTSFDKLKPHTSLTNTLTVSGAVRTQGGGQFRVFTPFGRATKIALDQNGLVGLAPPSNHNFAHTNHNWAPIDALNLSAHHFEIGRSSTQSGQDWAIGFDCFNPGEDGAHKRWREFLDYDIHHYAQNRDRPDLNHTSRLSPHLRFGEISPHRLWADLNQIEMERPELRSQIDKFRSEVLWREFSYELLSQFPDLHKKNIREEFNKFPWEENEKALKAWQKGMTGYQLVDAGMKELWQTGFMHNRVRMIAASFLIKHLMIDWRYGEAWFWDCLVDADPANNPASWQWVAGSGADAAPYFRIFNPITAAEKFDPQGLYRKKYIGYADNDDLFSIGTRPKPIIEHMNARERALSAFHTLKTEVTI